MYLSDLNVKAIVRDIREIRDKKRNKILVSAIEHPAVLEVAVALRKEGYEVKRIPVDKEGILKMEELEKELDSGVLLVSVMHVNNEIGVVQDLAQIGAMCKEKGAIFHTDAVQSFGKEKIDVEKMGIDLLSTSAHKIGGPKGIGFLYKKDGVKLSPIIYGGGQENGARSGTENVPGIVGFAKALELQGKVDKEKIEKMRDKLISGLEKLGGKINGSKKQRIAGNVHVSFPGLEGDSLVLFLSEKGIMASTGSACSSKNKEESSVLKALGLNKKELSGSLRFTLGPEVKDKDIDYVLQELGRILATFRYK